MEKDEKTQMEIQSILMRCNSVLKPMRKPQVCWDKILLTYFVLGFLLYSIPGILLAIFVHWIFAVIFCVLYLSGFPFLMFC